MGLHLKIMWISVPFTTIRKNNLKVRGLKFAEVAKLCLWRSAKIHSGRKNTYRNLKFLKTLLIHCPKFELKEGAFRDFQWFSPGSTCNDCPLIFWQKFAPLPKLKGIISSCILICLNWFLGNCLEIESIPLERIGVFTALTVSGRPVCN